MSILEFLKLDQRKTAVSSAETETVRKIADALDRMEPERARYVAAFAYLLSRVARADLHISTEETHIMEHIVMERGGLPEEQAILVVQMAKTQNVLFGSTENFLVTREFKEMAKHEGKISLLRCLFAVAAADEAISTIEDNEIRQIADEIRVEHRDFIAVRREYRDHLAVLKKPTA